MIYIAFGKLSLKKLIKSIGYLYLVSFIVIGTILSVFYIYGIPPFQVKNFIIIIFGILILLFLGKIGWRIFQNYITPEEFYVPLKIYIKEMKIEVTGLVDTGNQLSDPLTGVPVLIVEMNQMKMIFSEKLIDEITKSDDLIKLIDIFNKYGWEDRIRVLPFSDLGQEQGMLLGFRPDRIKISYKKNIIETKKVIIGLTERTLDDNNKYQALIHPQLINF